MTTSQASLGLLTYVMNLSAANDLSRERSVRLTYLYSISIYTGPGDLPDMSNIPQC